MRRPIDGRGLRQRRWVWLTSESHAIEGAVASLLSPLRQRAAEPDDDTLGESPAETLADLELCLSEAMNNCIEHAYGGRPGQPIALGLRLGAGMVRLTVADRGAPLPPDLCRSIGEEAPMPAPRVAPDDPMTLPEGGWGWPLIRATTDRIAHRRLRGWTVLVLEKSLEPSAV